jgi:hypothetical protein
MQFSFVDRYQRSILVAFLFAELCIQVLLGIHSFIILDRIPLPFQSSRSLWPNSCASSYNLTYPHLSSTLSTDSAIYTTTKTSGLIMTVQVSYASHLSSLTLLTPQSTAFFFFQTFPFFGVLPVLLDENGKEIHGPGEGYLVFRRPWPGIMRTLFGNHERFETTYFKKFPGYYCTGDGEANGSSVPIGGGIYELTKLHSLSPRANYTDRATAACRRSDCQFLRIKGATWSAWRIPTAVFSVF